MAKRPRILILSAYYFPFQGGTETHARTLAVYLLSQGFEVVVVTKRDDRGSAGVETIDGIRVHRVAPRGPRSGFRKWAMIPFAIARILDLRREFDLIYCPGYQGIGMAAIAAGWVLGRPVVLRSGNLGVLAGGQWNAPLARWRIRADRWPVPWLKAAMRRLYTGADAFACNCRDNEQEALAYGVPRDRVHYLPNAVDVQRFYPADAGEKARIRASHGWPAGVFLYLYLGRLSIEKGVLDLLEAWRAAALPQSVLVLVGPDMPGHPMDAGVAARQYVAAHNLGDRVIFHGESTDPAPLLRAADAYVQPSHYEAFSNAIIEAMATGLPLVASCVGGVLDCVVDRENGLLSNPGDAMSIASCLRQLKEDPALAARLGAAARQTVVEHFNDVTILRRFADLFVAICAGRSAN